MYAIGAAALMIGVCIKTLRRWDKKGSIPCVRTLGGHRLFPVQEITHLLKGTSNVTGSTLSRVIHQDACAIYGHVSSHKQYKRGDLERQIDQIKDHALEKGLNVYHVYKDVSSGLNTTRKNLWKMLRDARKGCFSQVLLTYKDRLTRFGYTYLQNYLAEFNVSVSYLNELDAKTPEGEMVEDLVAIIHSFSGKLYRMRLSEKERGNDTSVVEASSS